MAFNFDYMKKKSYSTSDVNPAAPIVKIFNMSKTSQASYLFLNPEAVKLLALQKDEYVRVGIDIETKKIVICPTLTGDGRKLSKNPSGSATISVSNLIDENNIQTQICEVGFNRNYVRGGLIFTYAE